MATRETAAVSAEERVRFEREGYLVFDPELPEELIEGVLRDMDDKYIYEGETRRDELKVLYGAGERPRVLDGWRISENVRRLALAPKVLAVCEQLYGRQPLPFQTLNFPRGTEQLPHADAMHFNSDPPGIMCGVWIALEDMDMDNGPLVYYPGSHKLPLPTWDEIGPDDISYPHYDDLEGRIEARYQRYDAYVQRLLERHEFEPTYGLIRRGQALLWAANLVHGGSRQRDKARTRHSQVTHFYFEGCRYHTPMRSEGDRAFWRYPWWVRSEGVRDVESQLREVVDAGVPAGATVLVMGKGTQQLDLGDRRPRPFSVIDDVHDQSGPGEERRSVRELEALRAEGADFLLVPKHELGRLTNDCNDLQQHLETRYPAIVRDGGCCAIYDLRSP